MKRKDLGHLKTILFTLKTSKNVGFGGPMVYKFLYIDFLGKVKALYTSVTQPGQLVWDFNNHWCTWILYSQSLYCILPNEGRVISNSISTVLLYYTFIFFTLIGSGVLLYLIFVIESCVVVVVVAAILSIMPHQTRSLAWNGPNAWISLLFDREELGLGLGWAEVWSVCFQQNVLDFVSITQAMGDILIKDAMPYIRIWWSCTKSYNKPVDLRK